MNPDQKHHHDDPNKVDFLDSSLISEEIMKSAEKIKAYAVLMGFTKPWSICGLSCGEPHTITDNAPHFPFTSAEEELNNAQLRQSSLSLTMKNRVLTERLSLRRKEVKGLQKCLHRANLITENLRNQLRAYREESKPLMEEPLMICTPPPSMH